MSRFPLKKVAFILIPIGIYLIGGYFFTRVFLNYRDELSLSLSSINPYFLFLSFLFFIIVFLLRPLPIKYILKLFNSEVRYSTTLKVTTLPQVLSYVPGRLLSYASMAHLSTIAGIPLKSFVSSMGINQLLTVILSLLFGAATLLFLPSLSAYLKYAPIIVVVGLFLVHPPVFNWISEKVLRILKKEAIPFSAKPINMIILFFMHIGIYAFEGISFVFLIASVTSADHMTLLMAVFLIPLARIIGYLSFITPAGFGVKEGIIILALKNYYPIETVTCLSIGHRMMSLLVLGIVSLLCLPVKLAPQIQYTSEIE